MLKEKGALDYVIGENLPKLLMSRLMKVEIQTVRILFFLTL
jgi:hypothetical protein